ncbi:MAG: hypothetical protein EPO46_03980 [Lysobacter sp.]|nr:MAG: hypothetical protein EPO46_03980 [Lysobacter sp.]
MSLTSLLLRLLLCVSLIANGVGFAQASVRMQYGHPAQEGVGQVPTPAQSSAPPCHRDATVQMPSMQAPHAMHAMDAAGSSASPASKQSHDDCCKGKTCRCACVQQAPCTFVSLLLPGAVLLPASQSAARVTLHTQPRLPHLIRPPIG